MIPGSVVGHPVQDDSHTVFVAYGGQVLKVVDSTELGCDGFVVADAVRRVLTLLDTDGIDGHYPHNIYAETADRVDAVGHGKK